MEERFQVGVITSTHGIKGEVKVFPTTDNPKRFKKNIELILDTGKEEILLTVENVDEYTIEYNAAMFHARLSTIDAMIKLAYTMFVLIFVPIYSNCGPRKKYIINLSVETKEAE